MVWADTCGGREEEQEAGGISNKGEAELVVALVRQMMEGGLGQEEVGVIAPYSNQVKLLKVSSLQRCWCLINKVVGALKLKFKRNVTVNSKCLRLH